MNLCAYIIYMCVSVFVCVCVRMGLSLCVCVVVCWTMNNERWTLTTAKEFNNCMFHRIPPFPPPLPFPHPTPSPPNNSLQHCFSTVWFFTLYIQLTSENHGQNFFFFTCSNTALIVAVTVRWENYCNCSQWLLCETKYQSTTKVSS